jgi:hypothetical protein
LVAAKIKDGIDWDVTDSHAMEMLADAPVTGANQSASDAVKGSK